MTNSQPHTKPTPRQLSYLKHLAESRGGSFAYPQTFEDADREIKRLLGAKRTGRAERRRELQALRGEMADRRGDSARVRAEELEGFGSSATWRGA